LHIRHLCVIGTHSAYRRCWTRRASAQLASRGQVSLLSGVKLLARSSSGIRILFGGLDGLDYRRRAEKLPGLLPLLTCSRRPLSESIGDETKLRLAHRRQIVATAFRTSSTAPRIKAITTTTAAATHTARMSFSIAARSELPARSPDQVRCSEMKAAGYPNNRLRKIVRRPAQPESVEQRWNVLFYPRPAFGSSNGNCRATPKNGR